jgi:hypothetical protein
MYDISLSKANKYTGERKKEGDRGLEYREKTKKSPYDNKCHSIRNKINEKNMNILGDKNISSSHQPHNDEQSNNDNKTNSSICHRFKQWFDLIKLWKHKRLPQVCIIHRSLRIKCISHKGSRKAMFT